VKVIAIFAKDNWLNIILFFFQILWQLFCKSDFIPKKLATLNFIVIGSPEDNHQARQKQSGE